MSTLKHAISEMLKEIGEALADHQALPSGARIELERIVISFQLPFPESAAPAGSIELVLRSLPERAAAAGEPKRSIPREPAKLEGAEAERVTQVLAGVLGAPGFDSSARAAILREATAGVSDAGIRSVLGSLAEANAAGLEEHLRKARHLIGNVLRSGPVKSAERGSRILGEIFKQHPAAAILQLIESEWKTQEFWL